MFIKLKKRGTACRVLLAIVFSVQMNFAFSQDSNVVFVNGSQPADQFERFIESPPPLQNVVYEQDVSGIGNHYYQVKWQEDAMFAALSETNINKYGDSDFSEWVGKFGNNYWFKAHNGYYTWEDRNIPADRDNTVEINYTIMMHSSLSLVLNWGCNVVDPKTIHWEKDGFSVTNRGAYVRGRLIRDAKGRASKLFVERSPVNRSKASTSEYGPWEYDYVYSAPLSLAYLPNIINAIYTNYPGGSISFKTEIFTVDVATNRMPSTSFYLPPKTNLVMMEITNGYRVNQADKSKQLDMLLAETNRARVREAYFIFLFLIVGAFLFFLWQRSRK